MLKLRSVVTAVAVLVSAILFAPAAHAAPIGQGFTVTAADLAYILKQIKIAEAHVANTTAATGPCGALAVVPNQSLGLRTVDGSCNHLGAGQETYGAAGQTFPRLTPARLRPGYTERNATDAQPRMISNLIADQSANNPAAVAAAHGGDPAAGIPNVTPDAGLSAPYNSWFTLFGQFFDHGIDLTVKGGGAVIIPLAADDPLVISENLPPSLRFMVLSRAGGGTAAKNIDTPYVDNSQTYTSNAAHQVFLREYDEQAKDTGRLLTGAAGGLPTWAEVKQQAGQVLGLRLSDADVLNVPMVLADAYGKFVPGPARGLPQYVTSTGLVEGDTAAPVSAPANVLHFDTPFLADIAHAADPSRPGYDAALLDRHYVAGDGRVNENIGLTAIHQIFHTEHNRLVGDIQRVAGEAGTAAEWTGDRLFQGAKFINEMEYQHIVFEEFARKIQPAIDPFDVYQEELDPAVRAEFAHAVYRFGHSMLTETITRRTGDGSDDSITLLDGFLNPDAFTDGGTLSPEQAAGAVAAGMSGQVGNEIDEFVTETLRNKLLGLPSDLAAINIARGRSEGVPPLNAFRRAVGLAPYVNWVDFGEHLRYSESLVNFIAAYGTDPSIKAASGTAAKRAAARALMDSPDFLYASAATSGLDDVDLWIGGLAEAGEPFGGLLGSTFNQVFENQMDVLQNGDRLYYLARTPGMNLRAQLEGNTFAELIMRTTGVQGLRADSFATTDCTYDLSRLRFSGSRVLDDPSSECDESVKLLRMPDGTIKQRAAHLDQSVWLGTDETDRVSAGGDDDTVWGGEGDDVVEGGTGDDSVIGGEGDDVLTDAGGADMPRGGPGNDAIDAGPGIDIVLGGDGKDFTDGGANANETFAGEDDDLVLAGDGADTVWGDAGDDWAEGGNGTDLLQGDSGNPFILDDANRPGNDVLIGQGGDDVYVLEGGDDIGVQGPGVDRYDGGSGFDWSIASDPDQGGDDLPMDADLARLPVEEVTAETLDRYREVEALSGGTRDDVLRGDDVIPADSDRFGCDALDAAGVARIRGLDRVVTSLPTPVSALANRTGRDCDLHGGVWGAGNVLLGGPGKDTLQGRAGDDIIDGDRYLTVRLSVRDADGNDRSARNLAALKADVFAGKINPKDIRLVREIASSPTRDVDTAVFSGARASYAVTPVDGGVQVSGPDGTDMVRNVELLRFDDQTVDVTGLQAFLGVSAFAGDRTATVLITVPDGVPVSGLTLSRSGSDGSEVRTPLAADVRELVVSGLTNGVSYTFRVRAETPVGSGAFSEPSAAVTPVAADPGSTTPSPSPSVTTPPVTPTPTTPVPTTPVPTTPAPTVAPTRTGAPVAPGAPVIGIATAGDESAVVRWTPPVDDGGSPIYGYEVQVLDDETGIVVGVDASGPDVTELTMTGLTNDLPYAFWVRAVNAAGASEFSAVSNRVIPTAAGAPGPGGDPGDGSPDGGSPTPTPTPSPGDPATPAGDPTTPAGDPTTSPTTPPATTRTVPGAPRIGTPAAGKGLAVVRWAAPASNGGSPILRYEIRVLDARNKQAGAVRTAPAGASSQNVTGLTNGTAYHFQVRAVNRIGTGSWSAGSKTVIPRTNPSAPRSLSATPGGVGGARTNTLRWTTPATAGGAPITGYRLTIQRLNSKGTPTGAPFVLTTTAAKRSATFTAPSGVRAGARYRFTVSALNAVGPGPGRSTTGTVR
ncbi:peroxidase family protein [Actinoplanes regularis]|uniref:peroxidase family protein n=1 Tax=Actinoplanes regularis TaxID=52697 RepID=UPI0024A12A8A|nr:peroxidase family protein [Actinoplanes regularis]GLW28952.1 hypothetical protein Areg01_18920 [Actinoplanes regularis]